jgi:hypothetical protein
MRILVPACVGLAVVSCVVSAVLWQERQSDQQLIDALRTQLTEAKTALAAKPAVAAIGVPTSDTLTPSPTSDLAQPSSAASTAVPVKITRQEAVAALTADAVKRQKALLADPEYRKALLTMARADLQDRYASLRVELGLTEPEAKALFDLLAESQVMMSSSMTSTTDGAQPSAAEAAEMGRLMQEQQQKLKDDITAMIGPQRYTQFEEYERMQPARTRVNNLTALLSRSGSPLTNAQTRSLTALMVSEQKRMEREAQALRDAGKTDTRSPADIQVETNRRILEVAPGFLDAQQVQVVRGRFEQRATIDRASDRLEQREREVLQEAPKVPLN